jgi:hypothetical protein
MGTIEIVIDDIPLFVQKIQKYNRSVPLKNIMHTLSITNLSTSTYLDSIYLLGQKKNDFIRMLEMIQLFRISIQQNNQTNLFHDIENSLTMQYIDLLKNEKLFKQKNNDILLNILHDFNNILIFQNWNVLHFSYNLFHDKSNTMNFLSSIDCKSKENNSYCMILNDHFKENIIQFLQEYLDSIIYYGDVQNIVDILIEIQQHQRRIKDIHNQKKRIQRSGMSGILLLLNSFAQDIIHHIHILRHLVTYLHGYDFDIRKDILDIKEYPFNQTKFDINTYDHILEMYLLELISRNVSRDLSVHRLQTQILKILQYYDSSIHDRSSIYRYVLFFIIYFIERIRMISYDSINSDQMLLNKTENWALKKHFTEQISFLLENIPSSPDESFHSESSKPYVASLSQSSLFHYFYDQKWQTIFPYLCQYEQALNDLRWNHTGTANVKPPLFTTILFQFTRQNQYNNKLNILIVGDGDFSFSCSLIRLLKNDHQLSDCSIVSTSYETEEKLYKIYENFHLNKNELLQNYVMVRHGVDATSYRIPSNHEVTDILIFNFPYAIMKQIQKDGQNHFLDSYGITRGRHIELMKRIFQNAKVINYPMNSTELCGYPFENDKMITVKPPVVILSLLASQAVSWEIEYIANEYGYQLRTILPFEQMNFERMGYVRKRCYNDRSFLQVSSNDRFFDRDIICDSFVYIFEYQ